MKQSLKTLPFITTLSFLVGLTSLPANATPSSAKKVAALLVNQCDLPRSLRLAESAVFFDTNLEEAQRLLHCIATVDPDVTPESPNFSANRLRGQIAKTLSTGKVAPVVAVVDGALKFRFE